MTERQHRLQWTPWELVEIDPFAQSNTLESHGFPAGTTVSARASLTELPSTALDGNPISLIFISLCHSKENFQKVVVLEKTRQIGED